jgi:hypothetical protein
MKIKKIYLDMDGVIANFERRYIELFEETPGEFRDRKEWSENWVKFIEGKNFETLDWWPGGPELITFLTKNFDVSQIEILSSSGGNKFHEKVVEQKNTWLKNYNIPFEKVNIVSGRKRKAEYATPDSILIDDTEDVVKAFRDAGGVAIHHKDYNNTIKLLNIYLTKGLNK